MNHCAFLFAPFNEEKCAKVALLYPLKCELSNLEVNMKKTVNILGTKYAIKRVNWGQDEYMERMRFGGYCDGGTKTIVILNLKSTPDWKDENEEVIKRQERETIRHEVVHAFLNESGLGYNTFSASEAWAKNEEMVDWFAIQFPKIHKAFKELGCEGE